jgi:hypothetical protein
MLVVDGGFWSEAGRVVASCADVAGDDAVVVEVEET